MANETMTHEGRTEPDFTAQTVLDATVLCRAHPALIVMTPWNEH